MFDLNLTNAKDSKFHKSHSSEEETSSPNGGACSSRASPGDTFNFIDIFDNKDIIGPAGLVTRDFFPVDRRQHGGATADHSRNQPSTVVGVKGKKSRRGPRSRSSQYRGVTFYRRTGRWESHIWDCGKQIYLGGFDTALSAARAYDRAAINFRGVDADINFDVNDYKEDMTMAKNLSKEEFVLLLRRQSHGFSRGSSKYRAMAISKSGRWEAPKGKLLGLNEAIKCYERERDVVANYEWSKFDVNRILEPSQEGSQHDLDLNLGISTFSPKESGSLGSLQLHPNYGVQNARNLKMHKENSVTAGSVCNRPLAGLPVALRQSFSWNGVNPSPNNEERASQERRIKYFTREEMANRAQKVHDKFGCQASRLSNGAASSGFSSLPTAPSYPMTQNLCFSSQPNTFTNIMPSFPPP